MSRGYDQLAWVDYPETLTPISAANLNRMENGIANLYSDRNKLESNIAYVEDEDTSSRHYDIDAYLMHNGVFYKVTEEINIGDTLNYSLDGNLKHVDISSQFSSTGCVELTQAQYDALPEEDKMADIIYLITDAPDKQLIELTQSQYDALSEEEKMADIIYLVTDAPYNPEAVGIAYDNTTSGLTATNVQDALDEIDAKSDFTLDTEVVAGTWLGKTLYWKMIRKSFTSSTSSLTFSLSDIVSSPTFAWVDVEHSFIDMYYDSTNNKRLIVPFTYYDGSNRLAARVGLTEGYIHIYDTYRDLTVGTGYIYMALYYTKD